MRASGITPLKVNKVRIADKGKPRETGGRKAIGTKPLTGSAGWDMFARLPKLIRLLCPWIIMGCR